MYSDFKNIPKDAISPPSKNTNRTKVIPKGSNIKFISILNAFKKAPFY